MKIFISWSGGTSHKVALALKGWLPLVVQTVEPYVSSEDIDKGARWSSDISGELEESNFGILCVTSNNLKSPWLNFEAGALSKIIGSSLVTPFLFGMKRSDIKEGPVLQFQSTLYDKEDIKKLLITINIASGETALDEDKINELYEVWWPKLKEKLDPLLSDTKIKKDDTEKTESHRGGTDDILEELLNLARGQALLLNAPEKLLPREYLINILGSTSDYTSDHPAFSILRRIWRNLKDNFEDYLEMDVVEGPSISKEGLEMIADVDRYIEYILRNAVLRELEERPPERPTRIHSPFGGGDEQF